MLEKTMKQVLKKKVNTWITSIDNQEIKKVIKKDLIITGGCFTSMLQNETPNDFDCYFRNKASVLKIARYYADKWNEHKGNQKNRLGKDCKVMVLDGANPSDEIKQYFWNLHGEPGEYQTGSVIIDNCPPERVKMVFPSDGFAGNPEDVNGPEEIEVDPDKIVTELDEIEADKEIKKEKKPFFPVFISSNAITLSDGIQIVVRFYGEPHEIHETYDFEHTKAYYDYGNDVLSIPAKVYECVINKTLIYTGSKYPVCSVFRLRKFISRGWKINAGQMLKICMQISKLNLMDINILEDQLIGVDSIYFMNLIKQFQEQKEENPNFKLTTGYLLSIIDKIF